MARALAASRGEVVVAGDEELPEQQQADPWAAYLPGQELVPAYLVSRLTAQYRVIVEVLLAAQDTSLTGMSFDDIQAAIRGYLGERLAAQTGRDLAAAQEFNRDSSGALVTVNWRFELELAR